MIEKVMKTILPAAIFAVAAMVGGTASAVTTCQFGDEGDFTATADVWTSIACEGANSGNDKLDTPYDWFGFNLSLEASVEAPSGSSGILSLTYDDPAKTGTWSVGSSWGAVTAAVLAIKGANQYAVYLLDLSAGTSGGWSTQALSTSGPVSNQPNISHISLYTYEGECEPGQIGCFPPVTGEVPVPASLPLLASGFFGAAWFARRRRKA
ncbi:VPLPA-CTERM sorting domain-containing protein [Tropicimonas sp. IMCC6043]|uniref:VPLPA-CTERM sorting domain-containing protein n=1 Tax=Tropicimonas sp. IMCC6043 TaxID=2510645 RepID=UPI00101BA6EB|nr:VPLPA-CTERM sorting domain-containing protein [Tropicimonas sp. IMCC6043]RYH12148.1 PEP-CTERM sorting domain-containing protein [Tropicimonas sp. IMCC6043]